MTKAETISQLKSLIQDRESFLDGDMDHDKIFRADIAALNHAIDMISCKKIVVIQPPENKVNSNLKTILDFVNENMTDLCFASILILMLIVILSAVLLH